MIREINESDKNEYIEMAENFYCSDAVSQKTLSPHLSLQ